MKIIDVLNEATYGLKPKQISEKIINEVFPKMKANPTKKSFTDISEFFHDEGEVEAKFFYWPNIDIHSNAEVVNKNFTFEIYFYCSYKDDIEEVTRDGGGEEELKEAYRNTIEHEVIHILDLIRSGGKKNKRKLMNKNSGNKSIKDWNSKMLKGDKEGVRAYFQSDLEMNRLLNQVVEFFKEHKAGVEKKILNRADLIRFLSLHETKEISEVFNEDPKLYRALILRLNREGVLPKGFK